MLWTTIQQYLKSWFSYPGLEAYLMVISLVLALVFGAICLVGFRPRLFRGPGLWVTAVVSAFLTMLAISFLFVTVQYYYQNWLNGTFSYDTLMDWVFVWNIPVVLVYGLIMEGAKMVPLVFWWYSGGKRLEVKTMITAGAVAGAAFGIFEAFYSHNQAFIQGWTWSAVSDGGVQALLPFWNQFWMIALNTALTAIVGYGLAKGKGWQFFLLASFLHAVMFYVTIFVAMGDITANQSGLILAVVSALLIAVALWLRWRNNQEETPPLLPVEPVMTVTPDGPSGTGAS